MTANQIAYQNMLETKRSNLAREIETNRSNVAKEGETYRSNLARETETNRTNLSNEYLKKLDWSEKNRHNLMQEGIDLRALDDKWRLEFMKDETTKRGQDLAMATGMSTAAMKAGLSWFLS